MTRLCSAMVLLACAASVAAAQPAEVEVHTSLSQTAVWVADRLTYSISLACRKGVDILADDLTKDKLHAEGLEILGSETARTIGRDDRTTYTFTYELTTYRADVPQLTIAPLTVRYYVKRLGQRIGDAAPAGEVQVPAAVIAFRSTLPDGEETYAIRDARRPRPRRLRYAWLQPIGVAFVLVSIVPAAAAAARRLRARQKPRSARRVREDERASLETVQALDLSTPAGRRDAYSHLNTLVRDHVRHAAGFDAAALTPAELDAALAEHDGHLPNELVSEVLNACDRARYAPADALPSIEACRQAIAHVEQILAAR